MKVTTSNAAKVHFAALTKFVEDRKGIVFVRRWNKRVVAVAPAEWVEKAIAAIGPPEPSPGDTADPGFPVDPPEEQPPAPSS